VHRWATYLITPLLAGHILIATGLLPGYRGVARSMHLGGRLCTETARRVWPGWLDRQLADESQGPGAGGSELRVTGRALPVVACAAALAGLTEPDFRGKRRYERRPLYAQKP